MQVAFLHGPVASGKLTVGRILSNLTGVPLFHNHLVVDAVSSIFPFGSKQFVRLRHQWWLDAFEAAVLENQSLIFTFTPESTVPLSLTEDIESRIGDSERVRYIELTCGSIEQERRVVLPSRQEFKKLQSVELMHRYKEGERDVPVLIPPTHFAVDTEAMEPAVAAEQIRTFLGW